MMMPAAMTMTTVAVSGQSMTARSAPAATAAVFREVVMTTDPAERQQSHQGN
jgi:hypothetical protein